MPGYSRHFCSAKVSKQGGRNMGGVIVFVKEIYDKFCTRICPGYEFGIVLKIDKQLFHSLKDIILTCVYIPPDNSPFYKDMQYSGIQCIESLVVECSELVTNFEMIICGDMNARTGTLDETINVSDNVPELHEYYEILNDDFDIPRRSCDKTVNKFGKDLIEFCKAYSFIILNGRIGKTDNSGDYTFIGQQGCSIVDYYLCTRNLYHLFVDLYINARTDSDHLPVCLDITVASILEHTINLQEDTLHKNIKYNLTNENADVFKTVLSDCIQEGKFDSLDCNISNSYYDINDILSDFENVIMKCSDTFRREARDRSKKKYDQKWFDDDCKIAKSNKNTLLKHFRNSRDERDRILYVDCKKTFKALCKQKKFQFSRKIVKNLENSLPDSKIFWKTLKGHLAKPNLLPNISQEQWFEHFKNVFDDNADPNNENIDITENVELSDVESILFNSEITNEEILQAVKDINPNKSSSGHLVAEHFIFGIDILLPYVKKLFNRLYCNGEFPESWSKSVIIPLHKKGNLNNPDNYRGIALLDIFSKIYIGILNTRVTFFVNAFDKISESQAGFRKGYSTIDNAFILYSLINKYLCRKGKKIYVAFVDFKKAFDSVNRNKLFQALQHTGLKGNLYSAILGIYNSVKASVRDRGVFTETFNCPLGVRQGCKLSPILFSIFINELTAYINNNGTHGIQLTPEVIEILILLFADDVALIADTVGGLQNHLNALQTYCIEWKLNVNVNKTKIVVFKNGGSNSRNERWFYNGTEIESVNAFTYVGVNFTCRLSLSKMAENMAIKAKKVLISLLMNLQDLQPLTYKTYFKFFDSKITPILLYGCELWGLEQMEQIERVQIYACKRFLNASLKSCNAAVMGDCGRYPIYITTFKRCIKFWLRIIALPDDRYVKMCYNMLKFYDQRGYKNWVTSLRINLCSNGFGYIWINQSVDNHKNFVKQYVTRLKDQYIQHWREQCCNSNKLLLYKQFKNDFEKEIYIDYIDLRKFRTSIVSFRASSHNLMIEKGRHMNLPRELRYCIHCTNAIEDEVHFLLYCPLYTELRSKYIDKKYWEYPTLNKFNILLSSKNEKTIRNLAMFIYYAMKYRKGFLI